MPRLDSVVFSRSGSCDDDMHVVARCFVGKLHEEGLGGSFVNVGQVVTIRVLDRAWRLCLPVEPHRADVGHVNVICAPDKGRVQLACIVVERILSRVHISVQLVIEA